MVEIVGVPYSLGAVCTPPPVKIRITKPLPLTVVFPSVTYVLSAHQVVGGGEKWRLMANAGGKGWIMLDHCRTLEDVRAEMLAGIECQKGTVLELILRRIVRDGAGELVA
jgi:hypothetical protein